MSRPIETGHSVNVGYVGRAFYTLHPYIPYHNAHIQFLNPKKHGLVYGNVGYVGFLMIFCATRTKKKDSSNDPFHRMKSGQNPTYPTFPTRLTIMVTGYLYPLVFYRLVYGNVGFEQKM